jgi:enoyl-CoA hydratase/carnithine racemase
MPSDQLLVERDGPILVVSFNREDRLNSMGEEVHAALPETWQAVKKDRTIRAIVITGEGTRAFNTGMDLKENAARGGHRESSDTTTYKEGVRMTPLQNDVWLPTIVAVNGLCVSGGLHFVADADVVIASRNASFFDTHTTVGQVSALEPIGLIPRIGLGNALRLVVLAKAGRLSAEDALRISLVDEVVEPEDLRSRAIELAHAAAKGSPTTIELSKRTIWNAVEQPLGEALQYGLDVLREHRSHPDCKEGPLAFAEKREPRWVMPDAEPAGAEPTNG